MTERRPQLERGDGVCVSISGALPVEFWSAAIHTISALGLTPHVYKGVPPPSGGITNNAYMVARSALEESRALVTVASDPTGDRATNFGIEELPRVVASARAGLLFVVWPEQVTLGDVLPGIVTRRVRDEAEFVEALRTDLAALMPGGAPRTGSG